MLLTYSFHLGLLLWSQGAITHPNEVISWVIQDSPIQNPLLIQTKQRNPFTACPADLLIERPCVLPDVFPNFRLENPGSEKPAMINLKWI